MLKAFVQAARLRTLPLAIGSIAMGSVVANFFHHQSWTITGLALATAILLQILSNFANDYGDFQKGTDTEHRSDRALASGSLTLAQMKMGLIVTGVLSFVTGIALILVAFETINIKAVVFVLVGLTAIAAAVKYTAGKNAYGYRAFGDAAVFIFFGLVAVLGMYYLHTGEMDYGFYWSIYPASALGLLATGVLNVNNIRDIEGDKANGKNTLAVKLGKQKAEVYQLILVLVSVGLMFWFVRENTGNNGLLLVLFGLLYVLHWLRLKSLENIEANREKYNAMLKFHVLLNLLFVVLVSFLLY